MNSSPASPPGIPVDEHMRPLPGTDDGRLRCPKCHADIGARPVELHQGRRVIRCACGKRVRVIPTPHAAAPRQRAKMSKKERKRQRARTLAGHTLKETLDA